MENKYLPEGHLIHTKENILYHATPSAMREAMHRGKILEGNAISADLSLSLTIDTPKSYTAIIPKEEAVLLSDGERFKDIAVISRVGKAVAYKIISEEAGEDGKPRFILSRRAAQAECLSQFVSCLSFGDIIDATVTHMEQFGAFCDIGCGISALMPVDSVSVSRISHPQDRLSQGERLKVAIKAKDDKGRLFISLKELCGTWEENADLFSRGETVTGYVRSIESYGIFVELTPNLAGLAEPVSGISVGSIVSVYIKSIIPEKMKIKLVLIDPHPSSAPPPLPACGFATDGKTHIDRFVYSPPCSQKVIETVFE